MKTVEQLRARELRGQGRSVKEIARELDVSQSSVSLWIRDIALTERRQRHANRADDLRLDSGVRRFRPAGVA